MESGHSTSMVEVELEVHLEDYSTIYLMSEIMLGIYISYDTFNDFNVFGFMNGTFNYRTSNINRTIQKYDKETHIVKLAIDGQSIKINPYPIAVVGIFE